jgi:hypothetical protein
LQRPECVGFGLSGKRHTVILLAVWKWFCH